MKKPRLVGGIALLASVALSGLAAQPAQAVPACPAWGPFVAADAQEFTGLHFISQSAQLYPGRIAEQVGTIAGCN